MSSAPSGPRPVSRATLSDLVTAQLRETILAGVYSRHLHEPLRSPVEDEGPGAARPPERGLER